MSRPMQTTPITIDSSIFRAYDIRGIVDENLTPEVVYKIALAIGSQALEKQQKKIIIARDGRLSGPLLSEALCRGLLDTGIDVIDIGAVPTPLLYFATCILPTQSGVMLTGSHNPANYNGLKIVIAGQALAEEEIQQLYHLIEKNNVTQGQGSCQLTDIVEQYIARITSDIKLEKTLKIVVDAGNGIAGKVAPQLYRALGCEVKELFCEVNGHFPHHHPDPSVPKNLTDLIEAVKEHHADVGLAFDGDGDRLGVITNSGEIIWPDRQLMLYAIHVLSTNPEAHIIYDVKCTRHLGKLINNYGGKPLMWRTGHSLIKQKMRETGALLAGEMSGHTFFKDRWYGFDDGLYTGARLLEILAKETRTISELFKALPNSINTPELKLLVNEKQRFQLLEGLRQANAFTEGELNTIDGVRVDFPYGWGLIRASNTTPHLIMRFEADTENQVRKIQTLFRQELLRLDKTLDLPF